ncbi:uncharacterized protein DUF4829 [Desulfitobacterium sp. LBE]|uniref:DUF4829 domain-containing protein n=1 Tax=Desulfitobacterium sp. LBE TaxID=884086 RepID=UPI00119B1154|nr:DUF4829 domain-containing protein [Desulfitobacterium sp. LBE]TWH60693.1 uncharacterized protein DUF4829 [Desulfitobacterium sp. LBE]
MKKLILTVLLLILPFTMIACSPVQNNIQTNTPLDEQNITAEDIEEGKQVIQDYAEALNSGDLETVNKLLGKHMRGLYHDGNIDSITMKIDSIEYPGRYTTALIPPSSYRSNYGHDPYKSMCLYVIFSEFETGDASISMDNWDYILIKETEESPWVIHDWGV